MVSTAATVALASTPGAWSAARSASGAAAVSDLVVAACATALALALVWLWLVTTVTVLGLLRGRTAARGATRRLVLLACGVAVVAGTSAPALAAGGDGSELLAGLSLPERAVAPHHRRVEPRPAAAAVTDTYVVRPATRSPPSRSPTRARDRSTTGGALSGGPIATSSATTPT